MSSAPSATSPSRAPRAGGAGPPPGPAAPQRHLAGPRAGTQVPLKSVATTGPSNEVPPGVAPGAPAAPGGIPAEAPFVPRPAHNVFEAQLVLARQGLSPGSIDGVLGSQTRSALRAFQEQEHLSPTGELDGATRARLVLTVPPLTDYTITTNDLERLEPVSPTWLGKSEQDRLDYETILELIAEKAESHPRLIQRLNPEIHWTNVLAGTRVQVPNVAPPPIREKAALLRIDLSSKTLEAFDANTNLLAHFPCSIARFVEKRPVGELHVVAVASNPVYIFDPENFPESEEGRRLGRKLALPPGPNNPVGTAWISLDRPGYGIHGTPKPEDVGRTESHGCFRLANWNANWLLQLVNVGIPVYVEP
ncbi:MAG: L,D-transpeptidase family protein [Verrucomicrobia bacterium]|nr:L,D-transpeptidase family protein [Verrucomicrobiota bacterium]